MTNNRTNLKAPALALWVFGGWLTAFAQDPLPAAEPASLNSQTNLPVLSRVEQIRRLSWTEAGRHYPVRLRGVVLTYSRLPGLLLFVADPTGGIYVKVTKDQDLLQGETVAIEGVSAAGRFAPLVIPSELKVTGQSELPPPQDVTFQRIASGAEDSQWVRLAGTVRSTAMQNLQGKRWLPGLTLATEEGGQLNILINDYHGEPLESLVDAEVAVTGVAESIYNGKRQLINVRLLAPGARFIEVRHPAPADILTAPARPIDSLRQFSPDRLSAHRVKVRGTVTFQQPGEFMFIRDETGAIKVSTSQSGRVAPGDRVEVLGFPTVHEYALVMEDAVFRQLGAGPPPEPEQLSATEAQRGDHDADLIRLNAQLLDQFQTPDQLVLVLQSADVLFRAQLVRSQSPPVNVRNGARLQITGICLAQFGSYFSPRGFQITLRSPADLVVLRQPAWWTAQRLRWALDILTGVLLGTGIWVWTLKRQVSIQTKAIRDKIEREAILQERMRIAREFHDNLEQELAGVKMQLELTAATFANVSETATSSLQMARMMISHSQVEARRSVWELRSQILEKHTLPAALSATIRSTESGAPIEVSISGQARKLPMRVESNLLRIAQEAVTNAIKHAKPRHISVNLAYEAGGTWLKIADDGCGFCPNQAPAGHFGHFGLLGMKERADKITGTLHIKSIPGQGTCVEIFVPQTGTEPPKRA